MASKPETYDGIHAVPMTHTVTLEVLGQTMACRGMVNTMYGYVDVSSIRWADGQEFTRLDFIHDGNMYYRNIEAFYQPRYLVTLARHFARDVVLGGLQEGANDG